MNKNVCARGEQVLVDGIERRCLMESMNDGGVGEQSDADSFGV
jgi:hypothetical protein